MPGKTIIYGEIIESKQRDSIKTSLERIAEDVLWKQDATLVGEDRDASLVFVDLDDPQYTDPNFLISLATAGKKTKLIGKASEPNVQDAIKYSRLGVSEILTEEQCLHRLHELVAELEKTPAATVPPPSKFGIHALVGESPAMQEIRSTVKLLADVDFPSALILGKTGTGKSLIAKVLHHNGVRGKHNMVEVNCSAIPDELFESELFGHVKGAFTDAKSEKTGLFEYAQNGTLFLDEVGNLSASSQAKLLKILEDKKLRKVGDVNEREINVRVVAATNLELEKAVRDGSFREDLFYRLNLLTIEVPPLYERPEDIPGIVGHYLRFYSTLYGKPEVTINKEALTSMQEYPWPGNVRELCNVIERAVLLTKSNQIKPKDIKTALSRGRLSIADRNQIIIEIPSQGITLESIEHSVVSQVLNMFQWNKTETAKFLRISRPRLRRIIESAGLEQNRRHRSE
ncbi:MAG: sigma-54-dependent Fis family transcriptional regulator [candidate division Zixibacteria bacterium]|nr:sigma-54-dependent Fis family transcriptional regulator [candidate division Zixibacteria bacterium]